MFELRNRRSSRRRGAAVVELAVCLPIFLLIVFAIIEFGRAMMVGQIVTNAAREGARMAIIDGSTNNDVQQMIEGFLTDAGGLDASVATIDIAILPGPSNPDPGNNLASSNEGDLVTVTVEVPFDKASYTAGKFLTGRNLTGRAAMRHE